MDFWSVLVHFGMDFASVVKVPVKMKEKINLNESGLYASLVKQKLMEIMINVLPTLVLFFPR